MSYAIVTEGAIYLYLYDKDTRLTQEVKDHLGIGTDPCTNEGRLLCALASVTHIALIFLKSYDQITLLLYCKKNK